jgi:hypothetical protein
LSDLRANLAVKRRHGDGQRHLSVDGSLNTSDASKDSHEPSKSGDADDTDSLAAGASQGQRSARSPIRFANSTAELSQVTGDHDQFTTPVLPSFGDISAIFNVDDLDSDHHAPQTSLPLYAPARRRSSVTRGVQDVDPDLVLAMQLASQSHGYSSKDVVEFIALNWILRPVFHSVWVDSMEHHLLDAHASVATFVQGVRDHLGRNWRLEYLPAVESFYFHAKRHGVKEIREYLTASDLEKYEAAEQRILEIRNAQKEEAVQKSRQRALAGRAKYVLFSLPTRAQRLCWISFRCSGTQSMQAM